MGTSEMGEETSKVGTMRGRGFPGNEQSKRSVPVVDVQLAASGRRAGVKSTIVAETTSPGFQARKAQGMEEAEQDRTGPEAGQLGTLGYYQDQCAWPGL